MTKSQNLTVVSIYKYINRVNIINSSDEIKSPIKLHTRDNLPREISAAIKLKDTHALISKIFCLINIAGKPINI
jgi:hypothetical protein